MRFGRNGFEESDDDGRSGSCEVGCRIRNRW